MTKPNGADPYRVDLDSGLPAANGNSNGGGKSGGPQPIPPRYRNAGEWVEQWLAPIIARKLTGGGQGKTWCRYWWKHPEVAVRFDALWNGWEAARASKDRLAMSSLWVYHIDAHLRTILDGETGPLYLCSEDEHNDVATLQVEPMPEGWLEHGRHRDTRIIPAGPDGGRG